MTLKSLKFKHTVATHLLIVLAIQIGMVSSAQAHFGVILPSSPQVNQKTPEIEATLSFLHPFEQTGMDLEWPSSVFIQHGQTQTDMKGEMRETTVLGKKGWMFRYHPARPGIYWLIMEMSPYWEPSENIFIVHSAKTVVSAYGDDQGWAEPTGVKTEIVPLTRPYGNYSGNSFSGTVLVDGEPVPEAEVEVEHFNEQKWAAPTDAHITQVVRTDKNGNFTFTCPLPGWWGFSALTEADYTKKGPDGQEKQVELGAVIWVYFNPNPFLE